MIDIVNSWIYRLSTGWSSALPCRDAESLTMLTHGALGPTELGGYHGIGGLP